MCTKLALKSVALNGSSDMGMFPEESEGKRDLALFCLLVVFFINERY